MFEKKTGLNASLKSRSNHGHCPLLNEKCLKNCADLIREVSCMMDTVNKDFHKLQSNAMNMLRCQL